MGIQYLTYNKIDKTKWDACINSSPNGLIYSFSFYLDAMAKNWDALVLNDYEAVMPLTWNKKYGICYLYQPPFTACLGITGKLVTTATMTDFLKAIPKKFAYWDIYFNHGNNCTLPDFNLYQRRNLVLSLTDPYEKLYNHFRENVQRNIKKCRQLQCEIKKNIPVRSVIDLAKVQSKTFSSLTDEDFDRMEKLYIQLQKEQKAITYGVFSNQELVASAAFFFSHRRAYYILVGNHPNGKTIGASHALINAFIEDHSGRDLLLDFEGSDINSLAFFYSSFGAAEENYSAIKLNRLPFYLKWFKK